MLIAHMRALHRQAMLVDVLFWILENDLWLRDALLEVRFDHNTVRPDHCQIHWPTPPPCRIKKRATRALYRLAALLDFVSDRDNDTLPTFSRHIIHALNSVGWRSDEAVGVLAYLAPHIARDDAVAWLSRHRASLQEILLRKATHARSSSAQPCRPRL